MLMLRCAAKLTVSRSRRSGVAGSRRSIALPIGLITAPVMLMTSMSMVHEHVHQRARRQEQPGQIRDEMRAMLGDDEESADDREQDEYLFDTSAYYVLM